MNTEIENISSIYKDFFLKLNISLDLSQIAIIDEICKIHQDVIYYNKKQNSKFFWLAGRAKLPKGIYLYGEVGRGKSILINSLFELIPIKKKLYIHYHNFMSQIHKELKFYRSQQEDSKTDYVAIIAKKLTQNYQFIYIDELEIKDITDAMLIGRLFEAIFKYDCIIAITSNRHPDELYKDGLQRDLFIGFIDLIKKNLQVLHLGANQDYRLLKASGFSKTYFAPLNDDNREAMKKYFEQLTEGKSTEKKEIIVNKRSIICNKTYKNICWFEFDELLKEALGSADYEAISLNFKIIFLSNIPKLVAEDREEARRFITLVDHLYINKNILICSAEVEPDLLYEHGKNMFEFKRTISRLQEMQSEDYLKGNLCKK